MRRLLSLVPVPKRVELVILMVPVIFAFVAVFISVGRYAEAQEQVAVEVKELREEVNTVSHNSIGMGKAMEAAAKSLDKTQQAMTRLLDRMNANDAEDKAQGARISRNEEEIDRLRSEVR